MGEYRRSDCSIAAPVPIAQAENGAMQRDYWFSVSRSLRRLESPEHVGKVAAQRTLRRLGARKVKTAHVPIVLDPLVATSILEDIFEGVNGDSVYRGASFLAGKLGQKIAGDRVNVIDDGTMPGGFGTSPFDGEGVPTRRTVVIENGVLKSYLLNTYTARKLGLQTTANASRGLAGTPGIGPGNYFLQPGQKTPQQIISEIKEGLYVTEFLGHGANLVTGDYSRGASGLWILRRGAGLSSRRDHRGWKFEGNLLQHLGNRKRPRIPRGCRVPDHPDRRFDRRRRIVVHPVRRSEIKFYCELHESRIAGVLGEPELSENLAVVGCVAVAIIRRGSRKHFSVGIHLWSDRRGQKRRKIPADLGLGRNERERGKRLGDTEAFVIHEEKCPVLDDRPAQGGAELILMIKLPAENIEGSWSVP